MAPSLPGISSPARAFFGKTLVNAAEDGWSAFSIRFDRKRAPASLVGRVFCGKPVTTFPENALI
jgi:hypothetical protein